jgi:hypothetical protein
MKHYAMMSYGELLVSAALTQGKITSTLWMDSRIDLGGLESRISLDFAGR